MYIENKSQGLIGDARIGKVTFSKTLKTLTYKERKYQSLKGKGFKSNYFDIETGDEYWISGCKKTVQIDFMVNEFRLKLMMILGKNTGR